MGKIKLMQGNEACVEGAFYAGMRFFAGYPITPSTEIAEISSERLPKVGGKFIQMEDEIASMAAVIGASLTGLKAMTASSGPGFSLKQENIGYAAITEVPCVIVDVQRGGPSTGLPTSVAQADVMQARWGTHGDHPMIALSPSSVKECYELTIKAFNFAEKYRTPVILLMDEVIGHMREKIELYEEGEVEVLNRKTPKSKEGFVAYRPDEDLVPPMAPFGHGYIYHVTGLTHTEAGFPTNDPKISAKLIERLCKKVEDHRDDIALYDEIETDDAEILLVSFGCSARSSMQAVKDLRSEGIKAGLLKLKTIWPFPEKEYLKLMKGKKLVAVPEINLGQLRLEIERLTKGEVNVIGVNKAAGEMITPDEISQKVKEAIK